MTVFTLSHSNLKLLGVQRMFLSCSIPKTRSLLYEVSKLKRRYLSSTRRGILEHGYLLVDYIETGEVQMLSDTWSDNFQNPQLRSNLFKNISRIILSLSQIPQPRIGSWTINDEGVLTLSNRPLIHQLQSLENEGIPTDVPRDLTYTTSDTYYRALLACHDARIRHQPNSILDEADGNAQMANLFTMQGLLSYFSSRELRHGPFIFTLTDIHGSNLFVDREWNIKYVIDLEWACCAPIEMLALPYWITNRAVDELKDEELATFSKAQEEFVAIFEQEEKSFLPIYGSPTYRSTIMKKGWQIGNFWYFHALKSPKGMFNLFREQIQPIFDEDAKTNMQGFDDIVSWYWVADARETVALKLGHKKTYDEQLRKLFEEKASGS